jgi:hypothetical protein
VAQKPAITWIGSPNWGYPPQVHGRNGCKVVAIVHHLADGTLIGTDSHFRNPASQVSTQFMVGKRGEIHQYVNTDDAAWGNGGLSKPDTSIPWIAKCVKDGVSPNLVTISVEYEGKHADDPSGRYHFTEEQVCAGIALDAWLCETYSITADRNSIVGHHHLDSVTRPNCPGPNFPFERVIAALQPKCALVPVKLPTGRTIYGELRGNTTFVEAGGEWVPLRACAELLGAKVTWLNEHDGVVVSLPQVCNCCEGTK